MPVPAEVDGYMRLSWCQLDVLEKTTKHYSRSPPQAATNPRILCQTLSYLFSLNRISPMMNIGFAVVGTTASRSHGCGMAEPPKRT